MDSNIISLANVSLKEQKDKIMIIKVTVNLLDDKKREDFVSVILPRIIRIQSKLTQEVKYCKKNSVTITNEAVKVLAKGITDQDSETATTCKFDITTLESLPWKKNADGSVATWPPSQDFLDSLGYGSANDEKWWQDNTGLKVSSSPSMHIICTSYVGKCITHRQSATSLYLTLATINVECHWCSRLVAKDINIGKSKGESSRCT